jgi:hypothetical protein
MPLFANPTPEALECRGIRFSVQMNTLIESRLTTSSLISFLLVAWQRKAGRMTVVRGSVE